MFGNTSTSSNPGGYIYTKGQGTTALRDFIRSTYVAGDIRNEERLLQYHLNWNFYRNRHWSENNHKLLSFNYIKAIVDKVNNFMAGKHGFNVNIVDLYGKEVDKKLEAAFESFTDYNWRKNRKGTKVQEILQMGSVCGDCFIFMEPDATEEFIKIKLLDSRTVVPIFNNGDYEDVLGYNVVTPLGINDKKYIQKVTEYTKGNVRIYFKRETKVDAELFEIYNYPNDLPFIPIVHIKNQAASESWNGYSDITDILKINKVYNEMSEDVKSIIDYYATPTTVVTGAAVADLKRGLNQIWSGLPSDANVFNLTLGEDLSASMNFLEMLKKSMFDFTGVPENVLGQIQHVSNTSAAALHIMYQPLIESADRKWLSYGDGFELMNEMCAYMFLVAFPSHTLTTGMPAKEDLKRFRAVPMFTYGLPTDRTIQLNEADIEIRNGLGSRQEVMERLGKKNIPLIMTQVEDDLKYLKAKTEAISPPEPTPPVPGETAKDVT